MAALKTSLATSRPSPPLFLLPGAAYPLKRRAKFSAIARPSRLQMAAIVKHGIKQNCRHLNGSRE
jgi:hypothetical protein